MSAETVDFYPEPPCGPKPGPPATDEVVPVEDLIGVSVPLGVRYVSRVALNLLRYDEAVVSYHSADFDKRTGRPLRIQRRPQA